MDYSLFKILSHVSLGSCIPKENYLFHLSYKVVHNVLLLCFKMLCNEIDVSLFLILAT